MPLGTKNATISQLAKPYKSIRPYKSCTSTH